MRWTKPSLIFLIVFAVAVMLDSVGPIEAAAYLFIAFFGLWFYNYMTNKYIH